MENAPLSNLANTIFTLAQRIRQLEAVEVSNGTLLVDGIIFTITEIDNGDSPYTLGDHVVLICDTALGAITVNLPAIATNQGRAYWIKNIDANNVTVDGNGAETIDGNATITLVEDDAALLIAFSTEWGVF
jgi:hypothetical protein